MPIFLKLILAHLLGDFILQPDSWLLHKEKKKLKSALLYLHLAIHGLLVFTFVQSWIVTAIIVLSHAAIDSVRIFFSKDKTKQIWYVADQLLHLAVIVGIALWSSEIPFVECRNWLVSNLKYIVAVVFLTTPSSVIVKHTVARWNPEKDRGGSSSLEKAGTFIGIFERLFVFGFVVVGHLEAVGFLLAAKSVLWFGDLRKAEDRRMKEYLLIGTLVSFGLALLIGALVTRIET